MASQMRITGTLSPDATGIYTEAGTYGGSPYFRRGTDSWYLWRHYTSDGYWRITEAVGTSTAGVARWANSSTDPVGTYSPGSPATGTATVAACIVGEMDCPGADSEASIVSDCGIVLECPGVASEAAIAGGVEVSGVLVGPGVASESAAVGDVKTRHYADFRGLYRIFTAPEYRFYRSNVAPPAEDDTPFATSSSLPATPNVLFADGTWYLSVSYFNGCLDSGFLPVGPNGETYLTLTIADGAAEGTPPLAPFDVRATAEAGGVVRVFAIVWLPTSDAPDEWAIGYTVNGSTPAEDTPSITVAMAPGGLAVLDYALPAQAHGTTVKVRVQTRRNDGTDETPAWTYSDGSTVLTVVADAQGPTAPTSIEHWPGSLPEDF